MLGGQKVKHDRTKTRITWLQGLFWNHRLPLSHNVDKRDLKCRILGTTVSDIIAFACVNPGLPARDSFILREFRCKAVFEK